MAYDPIFIANLVVTVGLVWMVLNHYEIVKYNPIDHATEEIQRLVYYNQLDGSVMPPPETLMTVVSVFQIQTIWLFSMTLNILLFY